MNAPEYLTAAEVAALFKVDVKTVGRWVKAGRVTAGRTPGGHRRFPAEQFADQFPHLREGGAK